MKVLVTGGTGFIGSHLIERIRQKGHQAICIAKDRLNLSTIESLNVRVILGDLNNGVAWNSILHDVDYIYHLAGVVRAQRCSVELHPPRRRLYLSPRRSSKSSAVQRLLRGQLRSYKTFCSLLRPTLFQPQTICIREQLSSSRPLRGRQAGY